MPHLNFTSDNANISRFDHKNEDTNALRQSVSVQLHVSIADLTHPAGCAFGLTLFDLQENPDTFNIAGKKIRLLVPTVTGSGDKFKVFLDNDLLGETVVPVLITDSITLVEFRFWRYVDSYKAMYLIDGDVKATINIPDTVLGPNVRFRAGVSIAGAFSIKVYNIVYSKKDLVAKTVGLQGTGSFNVPTGQTDILLTGRGGAGNVTVFDIGDTLSSDIKYIVKNNIIDPSSVVDNCKSIASSRYNLERCNPSNDDFLIFDNSTSYNKHYVYTLNFFKTIKVTPPNMYLQAVCHHAGVFYFYTSTQANAHPTITYTDGSPWTPNSNILFKTTDFNTIDIVQTFLAPIEAIQKLINNNDEPVLIVTTSNYNNPVEALELIYNLETQAVDFLNVYHIQGQSSPPKKIPNNYDNRIISFNNKYYCFTGTSTDLINWEPYTNPPNGGYWYTQNTDNLVFGNGYIVYHYAGSKYIQYTSDDFQTKTTYTHVTDIEKVIYVNGEFVLFSNTYQIYTGPSIAELTPHPSYPAGFRGDNTYPDAVAHAYGLRLLGFEPPIVVGNKLVLIGRYRDLATAGALGINVYIGESLNSLKRYAFYDCDGFIHRGDRLLIRSKIYDETSTGYSSIPAFNFTKNNTNPKTIFGYVLDTEIGIKTSVTGNYGAVVDASFNSQKLIFSKSKTKNLPNTTKILKNVSVANSALVEYVAPIETNLNVTYLDTVSTDPAYGTLIGYSCDGFNKVELLADGIGGTYQSIIEKNSAFCGYIADTLKSIALVGNGQLTIPAGVASLRIIGRGSSMSPKVLNIAGSKIELNFDVINSPIKNIKQVLFAAGRYVVICDIPLYRVQGSGLNTHWFGSNGLNSGLSVYVGDTLETLVRLDTGTNKEATHVEYFEAAGVFVLQFNNNAIYTSANASPNFTDWSLRTLSYGIKGWSCNNKYMFVGQQRHYYTSDFETMVNNNVYLNVDSLSLSFGLVTTEALKPKKLNNSIYFIGEINYIYSNGLGPAEIGGFKFNNGVFTRINKIEGLTANSNNGHTGIVGEEDKRAYVISILNEIREEHVGYSNYFRQNLNSPNEFAVNSKEEIFALFSPVWDFNTCNRNATKTVEIRPVETVNPSTGLPDLEYKLFKSNFSKLATTTCTSDVYITTDHGELFYTTDCKNQESWIKYNLDKRIKNSLSNPFTLYDTTFYQSDVSGIITSKTIPAGEPYVARIQEYGEDATITIGDKLKFIKGNRTESTPAALTDETIALDPGKETHLLYRCPPGSLVTIEYMMVNDGSPAAGTFLTESCDGFNKVGIYANGIGGTYTSLIEQNSLSCGYVVPVAKASVIFEEQATVAEGKTHIQSFILSSPLDVDVSFTINFEFTANASALDITNLKYTCLQNGAGQPSVTSALVNGQTVVIPAFTTEVFIEFDTIVDDVNEADELFKIKLTPVLNANRILTPNIETAIKITNVEVWLDPAQITFSGEYLDDVTGVGNAGYRTRIRGLVNKFGVLKTGISKNSGKYYIPLTGIDLNNLIIGFGNTTFPEPNGVDYIYPGIDAASWGITNDGYYHNGVFVGTVFSWNYENTGLYLDIDNGVADIVTNGVRQNLNIAISIAGPIHVYIGSINSVIVRGFYLDFNGETQITYTPEPGVMKGFGDINRSDNITRNVPWQEDKIIPTNMTSAWSTENAGIISVNAKTTARSVFSTNENIWVVEFDVNPNTEMCVGICTSNHPITVADELDTNTIQLGNNAFSYGVVMSGGTLFARHNAVTSSITINTDTVITLIINLAEKNLSIVDSSSTKQILFENISNDNYYLAVSTTVSANDGGNTTFVNTGRLYTNYEASSGRENDTIIGFGSFIGNPPEGLLKSTFCDEFTYNGIYHDGLGGTIPKTIQEYSQSCGYSLPDDSTSGWDKVRNAPNTAYSTNGSIIHLLSGNLMSSKMHAKGKYYFEVLCDKQNLIIGLGQNNYDYTNQYGAPGNGDYSTGINTTNATLYNNWSQMGDSFNADLNDHWINKTIGVMVDFDNYEISVKYEDGTIKPFNASLGGIIPPAFVVVYSVDENDNGIDGRNISVNLGNVPFVNGLPAGYSSWVTNEIIETDPHIDNVAFVYEFVDAGDGNIYDDTPMENTAVINGTATFVENNSLCLDENGMVFNGAVNVVSPTSGVISLSEDFTLELDIIPDGTITTEQVLFTTTNTATPPYPLKIVLTLTGNIVVNSYSDATTEVWSITSSGIVTNNVRNAIAVTREAETFKLFINGVVMGSTVFAGTLATATSVTIGAKTDASAGFTGIIDSARYTSGVCRYNSDYTVNIKPYSTLTIPDPYDPSGGGSGGEGW